jgi:DNA (cytosine-5)-methyltransferase 1
MLASRGLGVVLGDLSQMGYDAEWGVLGANDVGAPHKRDRTWIVANADGFGGRGGDAQRQDAVNAGESSGDSGDNSGTVGWWSTEPDVGRVAHGVASRVDRLKAIGNGQVPLVAATAWTILKQRLTNQ